MQNNASVYSRRNDGRRLQQFVSEEVLDVACLNLTAFCKELNVWEDGDEVSEPSFLLSLEGCAEQKWHYDYDIPTITADQDMPRSCILAIDPFDLRVAPGVVRGVSEEGAERATVHVNRRGLIVFRGDLYHAGGEGRGMRLHWFLDKPRVPGGRHPTGYTVTR